MIKKVLFITLLSMSFIGYSLPPELQAREGRKPLRILCTILPVYIFTLNVVGQVPDVDVKLLLPPHQGCPHNYDLTPGDLKNLSRADVIVANGLGMESFLNNFVKEKKGKISFIEGAAKIEPIREAPQPSRLRKTPEKTGHDHSGEINGHAWVSPEKAAVMVKTIAEGLAGRDPERSHEFLENGRQYARKLEGLGKELKDVVSKAANKKIIAFHDILDYLARDTGLQVVAIIESQLGVEPSSRDLVRLIQTGRKEKAAAIFSEPPYSDKLVRSISQETGIPWFPFDPVATGKPAADTYERIMKKNIEILQKALNGGRVGLDGKVLG
jgi:zinc transport system substrate-binding protein